MPAPPPEGELLRRLRLPLLGFVGALAAGTTGYVILGFNLPDALAGTALVLTTVGFPATGDLSRIGTWFTGALAVVGVAVYLGFLAIITSTITEGRIGLAARRRRMQRRIADLSDHYILCAYGRVGRAAAREFEEAGVDFVVIDVKAELEELMQADGVLYLLADPTSEAVLEQAGISRARGLICAVDSDAINVFITLTARSINPGIFIAARASEPDSPDLLRRAGADRVVSPYVSSGQHMAMLTLSPRITDYLEIRSEGRRRLRIEELVIEPGSPLAGRPLADAIGTSKALLVQRSNGTNIHPDAAEKLEPGDLVVLLGTES